MQTLEVSGAVRHIYVIRRLKGKEEIVANVEEVHFQIHITTVSYTQH
jgi:hypothetical protein